MERVSDTDRLRVIEELRGHCAAGRLSIDEYADRVEEVMAATTLADLGRTRRELPFVRIPEVATGAARQGRRAALGAVVAMWVIGVAAAVVLAIAFRWLWTLVLVAGWLLGLAQSRLARDRFGPHRSPR